MFEAKEDHLLMKGTWRLWKGGERPCVFFCCPKCGELGMLDHEVNADGTITPSVQCPKAQCTFHETVRLLGWKNAPLKGS